MHRTYRTSCPSVSLLRFFLTLAVSFTIYTGLSLISANRIAIYSPMIPTITNNTENINEISTTMVA